MCVYVRKAKSYEKFAVSYPEMGIAWSLSVLLCSIPSPLFGGKVVALGPEVEERTVSEELLGLTGWASEAKGFGFGFPEQMARRTNLALCAACIN